MYRDITMKEMCVSIEGEDVLSAAFPKVQF